MHRVRRSWSIVPRTLPALPFFGLSCLAFVLSALPLRALDVILTVAEPNGATRPAWPVTSGVPFQQGALTDTSRLELLDEAGHGLALQTEILARWPDGSVRWLLLDFQADLAANQSRRFLLRHDPEAAVAPVAAAVRVTTRQSLTTIDTGPLHLELDAARFDPLGAVWLDRNGDGTLSADERITRNSDGLFLCDANGKRFTSAGAPAEIVVEESGPLRACVRVTGRHGAADGTMFRYVLRLHAYRGQPFVRCSYTFINDAQEAVMTSLKEIGVVTRLATPSTTPAQRVFQIDENHSTRNGLAAEAHAAGWSRVSGDRGGIAIGCREFWQQWPKSIETRDGTLTLGLCPEFPAGLYDGKTLLDENKLYYALRRGVYTFKVGLAKTHEFSAVFFGPATPDASLANFFAAAEEPLLATCDPAYVGATQAAGDFPAADPAKFYGYDAWFDRMLEAHLKIRADVREYGLLNWGDWYGERDVNWGNLEYDLQNSLLVQYLRTGDRRFFLRGAQAARHHIDVDVIHATNPLLKNLYGPAPEVGEVWRHSLNHTGGYFNTPALPVSAAYQMGFSTDMGHIWAAGDLLYYQLTGDRQARDVAIQVADTAATHLVGKLGTHIRSLGWPMVLVLAAYEATGDPKYLQAATDNWHTLRDTLDPQRGWVVTLSPAHCYHPAGSTQKERDTIYKDVPRCRGNVPFMEGLTLSALARYHRLTGDPEVLKALTVGIDQMIRECWVEEARSFRYSACPLAPLSSHSIMLSTEALAYEAKLTGNLEHLRILREGVEFVLTKGGDRSFGKNLAQSTLFMPYALKALP